MAFILCLILGLFSSGFAKKGAEKMAKTFFDHRVHTLQKENHDLAKYHGKVVLAVNTASACGYTPQYAKLEKLYQDFKSQGLVVMAFPCNNFGNQEPGDAADIQKTLDTYGITFPVFEKIDVKGAQTHPLYTWLMAQTGADISWNFNKFLISREGTSAKHFDSSVSPDDPALIALIREMLADK